ncbi:MAG TPA: hypothetical protein VJ798_02475 [Rhizomicrobium sp.]|nr:hypothetical protein [Rhizomicrobium sp.]
MAGLAVAAPACADVTPLVLPVAEADLILNGSGNGAVFAPRQLGNHEAASGILRFSPTLKRSYDSGFSWSLNATLQASDRLARGRYDGDVLEKAYAETSLLLTTIRIGQTDGAGYNLAISGPRAGQAIDDAQIGFFADPVTGRAVTDLFALRTAVGSSSNFAKIAVESPTLFGLTIALSFTPSEGKNVIPWLSPGPQAAGRQATIWEGAIRYADDFGPFTLSAYAALADGRAERKLPGQQGIGDYGLGARADYHLDDSLTLSLGGSWRQSNAYAFDIHRSYDGAATRALDASAGLRWNDWSFAMEYGHGTAGAIAGQPRLNLNGTQISLAYALDRSVGVSAGWQHLGYSRNAGAFYDGSRRLSLDALYFQVSLKTVPE